MFFCTFILWILQISNLVYAYSNDECYYRIKENFHQEGDVVIAAFFPVHTFYTGNKVPHPQMTNYFKDFYLQYKFKNYELLLALMFAIEEINRNPHLLPNTSLGFDFYNIPHNDIQILMNVFVWLTGLSNPFCNYNCRKKSKSAAVLTGTSWTTSAHIGTLLQLYKFPQLTFGPFDPTLSDHSQFNFLYQMAPKDTSLSLAMVSLMLHFSWNWVGLIFPDDHRGIQMLSDLREKMESNKICTAFVEMIPRTRNSFSKNYWKNVEKVQESLANVIIIFGDIDSLQGLMRAIGQQFTRWKVWVMNSEWDVTNHADYFLLDSFHGSFIFSHHHEQIVGLIDFIRTVNPYKYPEDNYLPKLWFLFFKCSFSQLDCKLLENCEPNASLELLPRHIFNVAMSEESYHIYSAVYTVAHSLHAMSLQQVQMQPHANAEEMFFSSRQVHGSFQLHRFLQKTHAGNNIDLKWKQKLNVECDILNFWNFPKGLGLKVKVGTFSPNAPQGQQLLLSEQMIQWPEVFSEVPQSVCSQSCQPGSRKVIKEGEPLCCFDCTPCPENEISNETDADQCMKCLESHYANTEKNHCLQKTVSFLSHEDPLGVALTTIALCFSLLTAMVLGVFVKHRHTPIVKANNRTLSYILLITLCICFLCSLLFIGQPNRATCILQQTLFGGAFTMALATVLAKAITVVIAFRVSFPRKVMRWLMVSNAPNFIIPICTLIQLVLYGIWMSTSPPFIDQDAHAEHGHIVIVCSKGSAIAFHCVLGCLCSLAFGSFIMAFLSRNLPDTFNEAKFLSFSMLVFFCVWVTFLPVYHSTKGKVMVAMEVLSILASSASLLGFIFAPKCYIILFRPEKNTLYHIRDKTHSRNSKSPKT